VGEDTVECLADGCKTLAALWSAAWREAEAPAPKARAATLKTVKKLYSDKSFVPSLYLTELVSVLEPW
jgi:hypothetical protein